MMSVMLSTEMNLPPNVTQANVAIAQQVTSKPGDWLEERHHRQSEQK